MKINISKLMLIFTFGSHAFGSLSAMEYLLAEPQATYGQSLLQAINEEDKNKKEILDKKLEEEQAIKFAAQKAVTIRAQGNPKYSAAYNSAIQDASWNNPVTRKVLGKKGHHHIVKKIHAKELIKILNSFPPGVWSLIGQYAKITRKALPLLMPAAFEVESPGETLQVQSPDNRMVVVTNFQENKVYLVHANTGNFWDLGVYCGNQRVLQRFTYNKDGTRLLRIKSGGMISELIDVTQLNNQQSNADHQMPNTAQVFEVCKDFCYENFADDVLIEYRYTFPNQENNDFYADINIYNKDRDYLFSIVSVDSRARKWGPIIAAVAPNGDSFAVNHAIDAYSIWQISAKKKVVEKVGNFCAFNPDGKHFASHCANKILLYNHTNAEKPILELAGNNASFSPDGSKVLVELKDESNTIYTLDGKELLKLPYKKSIIFSLDGTFAYVAQALEDQKHLIEIYAIAAGTKTLIIEEHYSYYILWNKGFSADNRLVVGPGESLWDQAKKKPISGIQASLTSNGKYFKDFTHNFLWDVETRQPIIQFDFAIRTWYLREGPHGNHLFAITKDNDKNILRTYDLTDAGLNNFYKGKLNQEQTLLIWLLSYYAKNNPDNNNILELIAAKEDIRKSELVRWFVSFSTEIQKALINQFKIPQETTSMK